MSECIVYPSAVEYWLTHPPKNYLQFYSNPVHLMVPTAALRRPKKGYVYHVQPNNLPDKSFIQINPNLLVCTPELCFLQAALYIKSLSQLVCFANDLCGIYVKDSTNQYGQISRIPITSKSNIQNYLDLASGCYGIKHARRAIKYCVDHSNSPMESKLAALCCLPFHSGGFSVPAPRMNYEVELSADAAHFLRRKTIHCDMVWPEKKVALEYESNLTHLSTTQHGYDKGRATALYLSGYRVIYVTSQNLKNTASVERLFITLRNTLGLRKFGDTLTKYQEIRNRVLSELLFAN